MTTYNVSAATAREFQSILNEMLKGAAFSIDTTSTGVTSQTFAHRLRGVLAFFSEQEDSPYKDLKGLFVIRPRENVIFCTPKGQVNLGEYNLGGVESDATTVKPEEKPKGRKFESLVATSEAIINTLATRDEDVDEITFVEARLTAREMLAIKSQLPEGWVLLNRLDLGIALSSRPEAMSLAWRGPVSDET
ncbi:MAG: hypothetical protein GY906_36965 [bacterium]|nr:hypothetical protein [bacterium]